ncbi:MAG: hypothetical protein K1X75_06055 [Leptospirales bacterium]|nr:hypothetical protein [Leptospirales bacterium]
MKHFTALTATLVGIAFLLMPGPVYSQHFRWPRPDNIQFSNGQNYNAGTSVTFFGDSRQDLITIPGYGEFPDGWLPYLKLGANRNWNVQNLAVSAMTTKGLYEYILACARELKCTTATRYAVEIGGNDVIYNSVVVYWMPWRFQVSVQHVNQNQRKVVRLLKLMLRHRGVANPGDNLLWMGNFPTVGRGPISGPPKPCFHGDPFFWNVCDPPLGEALNDPYTFVSEFHKVELALQSLLGAPLQWIGNLFLQIFSFAEADRCTNTNFILAWFCAYQTFLSKDNSWATLPGLMIFANWQNERAMAVEEGIHFLDMYPRFVSPLDCAAGGCYTGAWSLYRDPAHPGYKGYMIWGHDLGKWMADHNWDTPYSAPISILDYEALNPPAPGGSFDEAPKEQIDDVIATQPDNFWFLVGLCFATGICYT